MAITGTKQAERALWRSSRSLLWAACWRICWLRCPSLSKDLSQSEDKERYIPDTSELRPKSFVLIRFRPWVETYLIPLFCFIEVQERYNNYLRYWTESVDTEYTFAGKPWKVPLGTPGPSTFLLEKCARPSHYCPWYVVQSRRSDPFCVARSVCFKELAGVFADCGVLH